jgi:hypothetical protein
MVLLKCVNVRKTPLMAAGASYYYTRDLIASACLEYYELGDTLTEKNIFLSLRCHSGTISRLKATYFYHHMIIAGECNEFRICSKMDRMGNHAKM